LVPEVDGFGPGFGRFAAVDVDGVWLGVAAVKNEVSDKIVGYVG
jgi:hypothetical protein